MAKPLIRTKASESEISESPKASKVVASPVQMVTLSTNQVDTELPISFLAPARKTYLTRSVAASSVEAAGTSSKEDKPLEATASTAAYTTVDITPDSMKNGTRAKKAIASTKKAKAKTVIVSSAKNTARVPRTANTPPSIKSPVPTKKKAVVVIAILARQMKAKAAKLSYLRRSVAASSVEAVRASVKDKPLEATASTTMGITPDSMKNRTRAKKVEAKAVIASSAKKTARVPKTAITAPSIRRPVPTKKKAVVMTAISARQKKAKAEKLKTIKPTKKKTEQTAKSANSEKNKQMPPQPQGMKFLNF